MGMMINCATLSRRLMDRIHCRTDAGAVLSVVRLEALGRVAALASGMHNPRAMQARSSVIGNLTLARTSCWWLVAGGWWLVEKHMLDVARLVQAHFEKTKP